MALVYRCDRCRRVSDLGLAYEDGDGQNEPPDGWRHYTMPVRGSDGAASSSRMLLCNTCEGLLYEWLHTREEG